MISLFVDLVLKAATSQRGAAAVLKIAAPYMAGLERLPCSNSGRLWLMRLGLYELIREKPLAEDWVWIMDHTVQLGAHKCLVIVGLRLSAWNPQRGPLTHDDLTLFNLTPMERSSGEAVAEQLEATRQQTHILPAAVLSDEGAELKAGMRLWGQTLPAAAQVPHLHDIKHKVATLLKKELHDDATWQSFVAHANRTRVHVVLTALAFLVPPSLKDKCRYMNLDRMIRWASQALAFLDNPQDLPNQPVDRKKLERRLGWLREYREPLRGWAELLELAGATETYIRREGYQRRAAEELEAVLTPLVRTPAALRLKTSLVTFVAGQSAAIPEGLHLPGSSEVLESLLGKYKRIQGEHSRGGMTGSLLNIGATLLKKSPETLTKALATIRSVDITRWLRDKLGLTLAAQQVLALGRNKNVPQIQPLPQPGF